MLQALAQFLTVLSCGLFAGATMYITLVERPARRECTTELDCYTFYGRFRLDSASRQQVGHRILLIQWDQDHRILLPAGNTQ